MTRGLYGVPIVQMAIEHYIFDLGYSVETVSEISGMDEESVRKIYDDCKKYKTPVRRTE